MLTRYMRRIASRDCPVVLSITEDPVTTGNTAAVIQRNDTRRDRAGSVDIYVRAREIYYRARRQRPVRAASIF